MHFLHAVLFSPLADSWTFVRGVVHALADSWT